MIVDTSALMAIVLLEPDHRAFAQVFASDQRRFMSAASVLEAGEVYIKAYKAEVTADALMADIKRLRIEVLPFTEEQAFIAVRARMTYGKGRHKAGLNFGDCFTYALAKAMNLPLLFKGNDFIHTDLGRVI